MQHDVSVIGLYVLDVIGWPVADDPRPGAVEFIDQVRLTVAGTAGATVVDCAKLGLHCLAVGAVGDDGKADFVLATLQGFGIDTSAMQRRSGVPTSAAIHDVGADGTRRALHARGASDRLDVPPNAFEHVFEAPIVHLGGTGLLATLDGERSRRLLSEAKARGKTTTFDLIAATAGTIDVVQPLLPYIDYFMPSIDQARVMSGQSAPADCAAYYHDHGATCCIFTMGGEGAYYRHRDGTEFSIPALAVDVVDTTGCGDAFDAGIITGIHRGMDPETCVRFAQTAAALVATGVGSDAGIASFDDTFRRMQNWPG